MSSWASEDFARLTEPFRPELLAHCYRMLGSVHDAEDQVQETLLRAWRSYGEFEGRSSLRTWLYRIATNACLRAIENRGRRPLPSGLGAPGTTRTGRWPAHAAGGAVAASRSRTRCSRPGRPTRPRSSCPGQSMRLALIAALQYLPGRQRAVLILRDVLGWRAAEVAELLGITTAAVNSLLQRARAQLRRGRPGRRTRSASRPAGPAGAARPVRGGVRERRRRRA